MFNHELLTRWHRHNAHITSGLDWVSWRADGLVCKRTPSQQRVCCSLELKRSPISVAWRDRGQNLRYRLLRWWLPLWVSKWPDTMLSESRMSRMWFYWLGTYFGIFQHCTIHWDIKPSNILSWRAGTFLLSDYGAARQWKAGDEEYSCLGSLAERSTACSFKI